MDNAESLANASLSKLFKTRFEYDSVTVLVIYWQDSPQPVGEPSFKTEGKDVGALFSSQFKYNVEYFEIPSKKSELALDVRLNELLTANQSDNSLLILHYGGHGDEDSANKRQSVWALKPDAGSPTLRWSTLQRKFDNHSSEVLMLFDCCFAAQAARSNTSPIPKNVELLVACGLNTKTVLPGPDSFTSHVIKIIRESLEAEGCVKISEVHKNLASKETNFAVSAIYYPLGTSKTSITLRPLKTLVSLTPPLELPDADLLIRLSLAKLDQESMESTMNDIVQLFKNNPPQTVSNVRIEQLKKTATAVGQYISGNSRSKTTAQFTELEAPARDDVVSVWTAFHNTMMRVASYLRMSTNSSGLPEAAPTAEIVTTCAEELVASFEPVPKAIERSILSMPKFSERDELLEAAQDPQMIALGLGEMLRLRTLAHFAEGGTAIQLSIATRQFTDDFPSRTIDTLPAMPQLGRVLIEARQFQEKKNDGALPCQAFFLEAPQAYGLTFSVTPSSPKLPISLHDILSRKTRVPAKPSLDERFQIAHKIGTATMKWHLIDWVHQGTASYNVVFFYDEVKGVDYANPYLCGFEYARKHSAPSTGRTVENFDLNVYRHPDRQGEPNASHQKEHDIYSYGVLLLELGLWTLASKVFRSNERAEISPHDMAKRLQETARKDLGHYAGASYQQAASICLEDKLGVGLDDKVKSRLAKSFETNVLMQIKRGLSVG